MDRIKEIGKAKRFGNILREQNAIRRGIDNSVLKGLQSFYTTVEKFTIVELIFGAKRYHGISVKSKDDIWNLSEGIARAYLRAFDEMVEMEELEYKEEICYGRYLEMGLINFSKAISDACCRISIANVNSAPKIDIDRLCAKPFYEEEGIYEIKCLKCGKTAKYYLQNIIPETRCPTCNRKLLEGPE